VALLQAQDALCFHAEGTGSQVRAPGEQRLPHVQSEARRHVQLVAQLTGEPDAQQHAFARPGDRTGAHLHVRERVGGQVDVVDHPGDQLTR